MRRLFSFFLLAFLLIVLCSCELSYEAPPVGKMHILVYGNDYRYGIFNPEKQKYESFVRFEDETLYNGKAQSLSCTIADATEVGKALSALAQKAGCFDSVDVTYLTDSPDTNLASFKTAISTIAADSSDNDITILYFSCHGLYLGAKGMKIPYGIDTTDNSFIAFKHDTIPGENVLFPISKAISLIDAVKGVKVVISDFCYSGAFVQPDYFSVTFGEYSGMDTATLFSVHKDEISINPSLYCLSASRYYEESHEDGGIGHGYFTEALLDGLGWDEENQILVSPKAGKNGMITLFELAKYVTANDSEPSWASQTPMVSGGSNDIVLFSF